MAATICRALHNTEINGGIVSGGRPANSVEVAVFDRNALLDVVCIQCFLQAGLELRTTGALDPERISRDKRLTEDDELTVFFRGLADPVNNLGKSRIALEPDRSDLGQRDCERVFLDSSSRSS